MQKYKKEVEEYIKLRLESEIPIARIAREIIKEFNLHVTYEAARHKVRSTKENVKIKNSAKPIKRLFFDIETSYYIGWFWRTGKTSFINHNQILEDKKIICISYKWEYEDKVHTLTWSAKKDDKAMIKDFIKILGEADEIIAHNGDRFDVKEIRTRAIKQGLLMFPIYRTLDTLKKSRKYFNFASNKLDYLGEYLEVGRKLDHEGIDLWHKVQGGDKKALAKMVDYCECDVVLLEDVFQVINPYIDHNTNFAVQLGKDKWSCPNCASDKVKLSHTDTTPVGWIRRFMKCLKCQKQYKISNKTYMRFLTKK